MLLRNIIGSFILLFSLFFLFSCSHMQVNTDYDPKFDFSKLNTFSVAYNSAQGTKSLMKERIAKALVQEMIKKGYKYVDKTHADFVIVFHTNVTNKTQVITDYQRVGLYPYYYHYSPLVPIQREYQYAEGKLVVDAVTPKEKAIFWRGVVTDRLQSLNTPEERIRYINKVVKEVLSSFPTKK